MIKVGLIPCQNGLGHLSRLVDLANKLSSTYKIFLISNLKKVKKFHLDKSIVKINFISNFDIDKKRYDQSWYKKIEFKINKLNLDVLISDNLPEIVFLKSNSIILSNFFWHEIFKIKNKKLDKTKKLIKIKKVKIFRNVILNKEKNFSKIGFFGSPISQKLKNKKSLLISFGSEDKKVNSISQDLEKIIYDKQRKISIFVDPKYFKIKYKNFNVKLATYDKEMFSSVKYAIIKPGFGTIKDCLKNKILIFCYQNKIYNKEFELTSKAIQKNNLGYKSDDILASYNIIKKKKFLKLRKTNKNLWNGEEKIIKYINKLKLKKDN